MDTKGIQKELFSFLKTSWETYIQMLETVQAQSEKTLELLLNQGETLKTEGRQMLQQWLDSMKKVQENYKKLVEENLKKLESYMGD